MTIIEPIYIKDRHTNITLRCWTLSTATEFLIKTKSLASNCGLTLALYGSTLTGIGRDLDIVAFPSRLEPNTGLFLDKLNKDFHIRKMKLSLSLGKNFSVILNDPELRVIDMQFRECDYL